MLTTDFVCRISDHAEVAYWLFRIGNPVIAAYNQVTLAAGLRPGRNRSIVYYDFELRACHGVHGPMLASSCERHKFLLPATSNDKFGFNAS
jgi:hypothetical protein